MTQVDIWTTENGREIPIKDLADPHLINILRMLKRNGVIASSTLEFYLTCEPPTADGASMAFDQEFDAVLDSPVCLQLDNLEAELAKRGLEL